MLAGLRPAGGSQNTGRKSWPCMAGKGGPAGRRTRPSARINNLRESIEKSKDKVLAYDEKLVRNFIKEIKIFPDKLTITVISGAHEDITI